MTTTFISPKSWEELCAMKDSIDAYDNKTLRFEDDEDEYQRYLGSHGREEILENIRNKIGPTGVALLANDFSYTRLLVDLPEVTHYCLWNTQGAMTLEQIREYLSQTKFSQWFAVERKPTSKSIPEIWHTHVFVKE